MSDHRDDHREIYELPCSYCRAVDRMDLDAVRAVYAVAGVDPYTGLSGPVDDHVARLA